MKLTKRLAAAAAMVPAGSRIADIGTDHGYIPVALCRKGLCVTAIAADVAPGPLAAAAAHVREAGLENHIDCRLGDGLQCLSAGEVDGVIVCGMGGSLISHILEEAPGILKSLRFLVLQPMRGVPELRHYLYERGWHIDEEALILEDGKIYEVFRVVPERHPVPPLWVCEVGPVNWDRQEPLLKWHIKAILQRKYRIIAGLQKSTSDQTAKIKALQQEIEDWETRLWQ